MRKEVVIIKTTDGLIGDFLGMIPTFQVIFNKHKDATIWLGVHPEAIPYCHLIPEINQPLLNQFIRVISSDYIDNIIAKNSEGADIPGQLPVIYKLNSSDAFRRAAKYNLYMSKAFLEISGLIPEDYGHIEFPKANLIYPDPIDGHPGYDFIISPFARSLPLEQKWSEEKWKQLIDLMPNFSFLILGNSTHDKMFIEGNDRVTYMFDQPLPIVARMMKYHCRHGLISLVTGTSHLAFHLGVTNYILNNQSMAWGTNPDGTNIRFPDIPNLTPANVCKSIELNEMLFVKDFYTK
jgi:hypothetical protein